MKHIYKLILVMLICEISHAQVASIDPTFNPGGGANYGINSSSLQPDGKIVIGGDLTFYSGMPRNKVARVNANGTNDNTFNPGTGADDLIYYTALQPDGKIFISGYFNNYNGTARRGIARLNSNGSIDSSFNPGAGINGYGTMIVQPDGKILIGGLFGSYNNISRKYIARANADGTLDTFFNPGTGANADVKSMALQPDGKIIIGGGFTIYNGTPRYHLARVNANGTLDNSFDTGGGTDGDIRSVNLLPDGKVIIAGTFGYYNGTPANSIARINSDGSLDTTFNSGAGVTGAIPNIWCSAVQSDGKVIIGGEFTGYDGYSSSKIARLNPDGSYDTTFNVGSGASSNVRTIIVQPDNKILFSGSFTSYNGTTRNRICRVYGNLLPVAAYSISANMLCGAGTISCSDTSANSPTAWQWSVTPSTGAVISNPNGPNTNISFSIAGSYAIKLVVTNFTGSDSLVKNIVVHAQPVAAITSQGNTTICMGDTVQLSSVAANSYLWSNGQASQNIQVTQTGNYSVIITDANNCSDTSNVISIVSSVAAVNPGLCLVTVDSMSTHNIIIWEKPATTTIDSFRVYRVKSALVDTLVGTVAYSDLSEFHDYSCNPNVTQYDYKLAVLDTCGNESSKSSAHRTILMTSSLGAGNQVNLNWNFYIGNTVNNYTVWRDSTLNGSWQQIATLSPASSAYIDNNMPGTGASRYRIEVDWVTSCTPTAKTMASSVNTTRSNTKDNYRITGLSQLNAKDVSLFPNPASELINVSLNAGAYIVNINVMDATGRLVKVISPSGKNSFLPINTSELAKGMYFIEVNTNVGLVRKSFVRE